MKSFPRIFTIGLIVVIGAFVFYRYIATDSRSQPALRSQTEKLPGPISENKSAVDAKNMSDSANSIVPKILDSDQKNETSIAVTEPSEPKSGKIGYKGALRRINELDKAYIEKLKLFALKINDPEFVDFYESIKVKKDEKLSTFFEQQNPTSGNPNLNLDDNLRLNVKNTEDEFEEAIYNYLGPDKYSQYSLFKEEMNAQASEVMKNLNRTGP